MLPIEVVSVLVAVMWGSVGLIWAVVSYWEKSDMTDERRREPAAEHAESHTSALVKLVWSVIARALITGVPLLFVVDGLLFRFGILYSPGLSFFSGFDLALQMAGVFISVLGLTLMVVAGRTLAVRVYRLALHEREMITTGLHRYVRHPFYLHFMLLPVGLVLLTLNYLSLLVLVFYTALDGPRLLTTEIREEEAELRRRFGAGYEEYAARTGRFLPRIVHRRS